MKTLLIVDGHNLLFQMFFGMPSRIINKDGKAIHGIIGFIGALIKIIKRVDPSYIVVLFDKEKENERSLIDENYKSNRTNYEEAIDENNPFAQLNDIYACLEYMGIKHMEVSEYETDDAIASYCFKYNEKYKIIISSFDSDFFQLINENVSVLRYRGEKTYICDTQYVKDKYNILPEYYADFKSLTGDTSDNIKGIPNVGPKTAAFLINNFFSIDNLLNEVNTIEKDSLKKLIIENKLRLINNLNLIKLTNKATIPFNINELNYSYNNLSTTEILVANNLK